MENETNIIGNSTTILNSIILMITGLIIGKYGATLLQFGIDQTILTQIITFIVFTLFAYINAKYHNTLFNTTTTETPKTQPNTFDNDAPILNDEYTLKEDDNDGGC